MDKSQAEIEAFSEELDAALTELEARFPECPIFLIVWDSSPGIVSNKQAEALVPNLRVVMDILAKVSSGELRSPRGSKKGSAH